MHPYSNPNPPRRAAGPGLSVLAACLAVVPAVLAGCGPDASGPTEVSAPPSVTAHQRHGFRRMLFKVKLEPAGDSRSRGVLFIEIGRRHLTARLHAVGLEPEQPIPQHVHLNPTCEPGGGILINLDQTLTVAGEGPGVGPAYPVASRRGVVRYSARRRLDEMLAAVNQYSGAGLETVDELIAWLDLENRNAHMHVPFGPPFPAVNCGEVERIR